MNDGRLLLERQEEGRDEGPSADHDEKGKPRNSRGGPFFFCLVVIGGSRAASSTSVAETASSTPSILKISTLDGLLTRAIAFLTLKCFFAICSAMRLSSSSAVTATIASARSMPV